MCILSTYSKHFLLDEHFWSSIQKIYFGPITVHDFYQLLLIQGLYQGTSAIHQALTKYVEGLKRYEAHLINKVPQTVTITFIMHFNFWYEVALEEGVNIQQMAQESVRQMLLMGKLMLPSSQCDSVCSRHCNRVQVPYIKPQQNMWKGLKDMKHI